MDSISVLPRPVVVHVHEPAPMRHLRLPDLRCRTDQQAAGRDPRILRPTLRIEPVDERIRGHGVEITVRERPMMTFRIDRFGKDPQVGVGQARQDTVTNNRKVDANGGTVTISVIEGIEIRVTHKPSRSPVRRSRQPHKNTHETRRPLHARTGPVTSSRAGPSSGTPAAAHASRHDRQSSFAASSATRDRSHDVSRTCPNSARPSKAPISVDKPFRSIELNAWSI